MKLKAYISIILILTAILSAARPSRPGNVTFVQPDGTTFIGKCIGDEFMKVRMTLEGHSIIKDNDGWWCYENYDSDGAGYSTGHRVGTSAPSYILAGSRQIPYSQMQARSQGRRSVLQDPETEPFLRRINATAEQMTKSGDVPVKHGLIILAQYKDVHFQYEKSHFVDLLTKQGYNLNGATGSAKEYFNAQFGGLVEFSFDVSDIVDLPSNRAYYGKNNKYGEDENPAEMIADACKAADDQIDFSLYDDDGDGYVDNVFVFFAGEDEAENLNETDLIWSHAWYIKSGADIDLKLDGIGIDRYACTAELTYNGHDNVLAGIGTFCHEYSHTMNLPDFYDTDYEENGWTLAMWLWTSLMDGGNMNNNGNTPPYFNSVEREILGIAEPIIIEEDGMYSIEPIEKNNQFYRVDTARPGEYYLIECRGNSGWDEHIGGNGILVYHIDKSDNFIKRWTIDNTVNAYSSHQCADIIEADGRSDIAATEDDYYNSIRDIRGIFLPNQKAQSINFFSKVNMTNVRSNGNGFTFNIVGFSDTSIPPAVKNITYEVFMDAIIIKFESSKPFDGEAVVRWKKNRGTEQETRIRPYEAGKYSITLEGLEAGNKPYNADICLEKNGLEGETSSISFITSRLPSVEWPYIYLGKGAAGMGSLNSGSNIALRVYNASEAETIVWEFNGKEIAPEGNGYYTVNQSGTLRATVYWNDGETDILEKEITITE